MLACALHVILVSYLNDFAAAYPSVNHSWIFHVVEKAELPEFICRFLRRIYCESTTHVEFAGMTRGQFLMVRGVRQGCPANGFLFAMAFDPIFRWLQDAIIPRTLLDQASSSRFRAECTSATHGAQTIRTVPDLDMGGQHCALRATLSHPGTPMTTAVGAERQSCGVRSGATCPQGHPP